MNVLVVDDSARMREAIAERITSMAGCRVVGMGTNGREALELIRLLHPDLVVLDINMPVMGGMEALGLLKRELPEIPVVMVSSILDQDHRGRALALGAYACVEKGPELWERLPAIVSELSRSRPAEILDRP